MPGCRDPLREAPAEAPLSRPIGAIKKKPNSRQRERERERELFLQRHPYKGVMAAALGRGDEADGKTRRGCVCRPDRCLDVQVEHLTRVPPNIHRQPEFGHFSLEIKVNSQ